MSEVQCSRCKEIIDQYQSRFVVRLRKKESNVIAEITHTDSMQVTDIVIHANGDRACTKQIVGYRKMLMEVLGIKGEFDVSFLDFI